MVLHVACFGVSFCFHLLCEWPRFGNFFCLCHILASFSLLKVNVRKRLRSHMKQFLHQSGSDPNSVSTLLTGCCRQLKYLIYRLKAISLTGLTLATYWP